MRCGRSMAQLAVLALCLGCVACDADDGNVVEKEIQVGSRKVTLKYIDQVVGKGREVKKGDTVMIHYTGTLKSGKKFDSSRDRGEPFVTEIGVGKVIQGWDEGVPGMKEGGKRKLIIPSDLAYGQRGAGKDIPPNADLIFEVEVLKVQ
jgi:peptidylprolyl isomerase